MLDGDDVNAAVQGSCRPSVVRSLVPADAVVYLERVRQRLLVRMEGDDLALAGGGGKVMGERGDPAPTRRVRSGKRGVDDEKLLSLDPPGVVRWMSAARRAVSAIAEQQKTRRWEERPFGCRVGPVDPGGR